MVTAALTAARFVAANWKWFLIGALALALMVSRARLADCRADFAAYKVAAIEAAQKQQKQFDESARKADKIYIEAAPQIITQTKVITKWIAANVENTAGCPTVDLVRVFNASITGDGLSEAASP
jgi:hypothetical protein